MSNEGFFKKQSRKYRNKKFKIIQEMHSCPECECYGCYKTNDCGTGCDNPKKQNYKGSDDPLKDLEPDERIWILNFFKIVKAYELFHVDGEEVDFEHIFETAFWKDPITDKYRWNEPTSWVNDQLNQCKKHLEYWGIDWKRIQDFEKPEVHVCNYDPVHGHEYCSWKDKNCQLRS